MSAQSTPEVLTVEAMRRRITIAARSGERVDGKSMGPASIAPAGSMIRNVLYAGEHRGSSGEDTMTMLAYYALTEYERLLDMVLSQEFLNPSPRIIAKAEGAAS